jgi:chromosome partitioning protein
MSRIIAFVNQKGGVGKTTSAINIGAGLAFKGKSVLIVDFDPQASLTVALGAKGATPTIYEVLKGARKVEETMVAIFEDAAAYGSLKLIPSGIDLSGVELELVGATGRERVLKEIIEPIKSRFDYVLIDCPPSLSLLTLNALIAADELTIVMQTEFLAMEGMARLLETVDLVRERLNSSLRANGIIAAQYDCRKGIHKEALNAVRERFQDKLFKTPVRNCTALAEASSFGLDIFRYKPKSAGALDYGDLVNEIVNQERKWK